MGRVAEGWKLIQRRGVYGIRWRSTDGTGKRPEVSLRTTDPVEAGRLAPLVYAEIVSGVAKDGAASGNNCRIAATTKLKPLIADWIDAISIQLGRGTDKTYIIYGNHWLKHLKTLGDIRPAKIADYQNARLKCVLRGTVDLELSAMRRFFARLRVHEYIHRLPEFPKIGDKVLGTKFAKRRREKPTEVLTPEQMDAVIAETSEWSKRKVKGKLFPVRARFVVARETGLRPITIDNLVGRDLTLAGLHIRDENDKNRWGRTVPLTARARAALESVRPASPGDLFFGHHEWDVIFYKAAIKALGLELADKMAPYDLKHGFVTELFDRGAPETGIQFLTGTRSAIRRYSHPTRRAAEEAIGGRTGDEAIGGRRGQGKTSQTGQEAGISYQKPKSKIAGKTAAPTRKRARV